MSNEKPENQHKLFSTILDRTNNEVGDFIKKANEIQKRIDDKIEAEEFLTKSEANILLSEVLDTLIEVGNGTTEQDLKKALGYLFAFRDLWFKNTQNDK